MAFGLSIEELLLRLPVVLFALTIHEFMHAWSAYKLGDDTAYRAGRVTLNPLRHLDLMGTLCLMFGPIGWAKPVPVQVMNLRNPRWHHVIVSGAGIAANFTLGVCLGLVIRVLASQDIWPEEGLGLILINMLILGTFINFALAIFNLLPIFPLDGSHILQNILPLNAAIRYAAMRRYGPIILIAIVFVNWHTGFLQWPIFGLMNLAAGLDFG